MNRIEINVVTGERIEVDLTPEEVADAEARTLAELNDPIRLLRIADAQAKEEAKADNVVQFLREHTPAECVDYVQTNVTDLASAKALMKKFAIVLCVLSKQSLR
jgi:hypothetical protein